MSIETIKARADAATPGPWEPGDWTGRCHDHAIGKHPRVGCRIVYEPWDYEPTHLIRGGVPGVLVAGNYDYEVGGILAAEDTVFIAHARQDIPALLRVAEAVAMMPTPISLNGCCTFCDAVMDVEQMTEDGFWPHEADCPLGMAHRALRDLEALP